MKLNLGDSVIAEIEFELNWDELTYGATVEHEVYW